MFGSIEEFFESFHWCSNYRTVLAAMRQPAGSSPRVTNLKVHNPLCLLGLVSSYAPFRPQ
jgi:hypothetical protein